MNSILPLFLVAGVVALCILSVQERDKIDRLLCAKTPWRFRLWWCALWVRKDILHPSFLPDALAIEKKINWERDKIRLLMNIDAVFKNQKIAGQKGNLATELSKITKRLYEQYHDELDARREIARKRDSENQLQQTPSV